MHDATKIKSTLVARATVVAVRDLRPADREAVIALDAECFGEYHWRARDFTRAMRRPGAAALVAMLPAPTPLAGFVIYARGRRGMKLLNLAVNPRRRRRGIGSLLLALVLVRAAQRQPDLAPQIVTTEVRETNAAGLAFFRHAGFVAAKLLRGYYRPWTDEDAIRMIFRPEWGE